MLIDSVNANNQEVVVTRTHAGTVAATITRGSIIHVVQDMNPNLEYCNHFSAIGSATTFNEGLPFSRNANIEQGRVLIMQSMYYALYFLKCRNPMKMLKNVVGTDGKRVL
jgi:hypothetical protein